MVIKTFSILSTITILTQGAECYYLQFPTQVDQFRGQIQGHGFNPDYEYRTPYEEEPDPYRVGFYPSALPQAYAFVPAGQEPLFRPAFRPPVHEPHHPLLLRAPQTSQVVLLPFRATYSFPRPLERIVQRVQSYFSIYNPPEALTVDRPLQTTTAQNVPQDTTTTESATTTPPQEIDSKGSTQEPDSTEAPTTDVSTSTSEEPLPTTEPPVEETTLTVETPDEEETTLTMETTTDASNFVSSETETPEST